MKYTNSMCLEFQKLFLKRFLFTFLGLFAFVQMALPHGYALQKVGDAKPFISFLKSSETGGFKPFLTLHSIVKPPEKDSQEIENHDDFVPLAKIVVIAPLVSLPFLVSIFENEIVNWIASFRDLSPHFGLLFLPPKTGPPKILI